MIPEESSTVSNESLTYLGDQLETVAKQNEDMLDFIQERKNERVICGYHIYIKSTIPETATMEAIPATELVQKILDDWTYNGEPLTHPDDVFNLNIDYMVKDLSDVIRLNDELLAVGIRYPVHFSDKQSNRRDMSLYLLNMQKLQKALEDLQFISCDMPNPIENSEVFPSTVKEAIEKFSRVTSTLPNCRLDLKTRFSVGRVPDDMLPFIKDKVEFPMETMEKNGVSIYKKLGQCPSLFKHSEMLQNEATLIGHTKAILSLKVFENDGSTFLASSSVDRTIKLWNLHTNSLVSTLTGHSKAVFVLTTVKHENMTCLVSGSFDNSIKVWSFHHESLLMTLTGHSASVYDIASYTSDNKTYLVSGSRDKTIKVWDLCDCSLVETLQGHIGHVCSITTYLDMGTPYLASGSRDKTIKIWNLSTKTLVSTLQGHEFGVHTLTTFLFNGMLCLASGSNDKTIKLWNLSSKRIISSMPVESAVSSFATYINGDTPYLVSGDEDGCVKYWNLTKHKLESSVKGNGYPVFALQTFVKRDTVCLACGRFDGKIELWME